jgi:hypothetical protein
MKMRPVEIERLAEGLVRAALKQKFVRAKAPEQRLRHRVAELIAENLRQEQALEAEAEKLAAAHAREMANMDHRRVIQGIKERLARERGFSL